MHNFQYTVYTRNNYIRTRKIKWAYNLAPGIDNVIIVTYFMI